VHALKSASASIGAAVLAEKAAALEEAGRRGDLAAISRELERFRKALSSLVDNISLALPAAEASPREALMERETLLRLREALAAEDIGTADRILDDLKKQACSRETTEFINALADCLLLSDFKTAAELTERLPEKAER
jgi:HPt (histidine-containing phosphotransfer) domain-containing protein